MKALNYILLLTLLLLSSCVVTRIKRVDCPKEPIICESQKWLGTPIDTSASQLDIKGYKFEIRNVIGLSTKDNEWSVDFYDSFNAYATVNSKGRQAVYKSRQISEFQFRLEDEIRNDFNHNFGNLIKTKNQYIFAGTRNLPVNSYDYKYSELVPVDSMIGISRIYSSSLQGNEISKSKELFQNFPSGIHFWVSQPTISPDGNIIVFSSDDTLGVAGTDLWYSLYDETNANWSSPKLIQNNINTTCDEVTPYFDKSSNYLYFASNGHDNIGGFDLFKSRYELKGDELTFSKPVNLGKPINTQANEIYPTSSVSCDSLLYYSSNQRQMNYSGNYDIYVFRKVYLKDYDTVQVALGEKLPDYEGTIKVTDPKIEIDSKEEKKEVEEKTEIESKEKEIETVEEKIEIELEKEKVDISFDFDEDNDFKLFGYVYLKNSGEGVENAVVMSRSDEYNSSQTVESDKNGYYEILLNRAEMYEITASIALTFPQTVNVFMEKDAKFDSKRKDFYLSEIKEVRVNFPNDEYSTPYPNILDEDGNETTIEWQSELDRISQSINQSLAKIEEIKLVGHTDFVASEDYNFALGKRRAEFIRAELIKRGVPSAILSYRSAGKSELLPRKENEDEELYRKRLRRVTMTMVLK